MKNARALFLLSAIAVAMPADAAAQGFTVHIPVELNSLHADVTQFRMVCHILGPTGEEIVGGFGTPTDVDATGSYAGTYTIMFNTLLVTDAQMSTAASYRCALRLLDSNATEEEPTPGNAQEWLRPKDGEVFEPVVSGPIVQG